ncbi:fungal-specific transcription factor domain-containing protein [Aspergillus pseudoustus]|uniref:Fungal-specific transcription factor domain-containing protein n=1 Tax=Aspergillus pseudoustus TaxID=1810923 RepID=A0ABR4KAW2_9EURO
MERVQVLNLSDALPPQEGTHGAERCNAACTRVRPLAQKPLEITGEVSRKGAEHSEPVQRGGGFSPPFLQTPPGSEVGIPYNAPPVSEATGHSETDTDAQPDPDQIQVFYTTHGRFAGQVAAAIDKRAGLVPAHSHRVPLVDAPLFENLNLSTNVTAFQHSTDLPSRLYADQLVDIYWRHIDAIEPVLDHHRFMQNYERAYSKSPNSNNTDADIWVAMFNLVFALAVQRQEHIAREERNETGNGFFLRAWALLPAETMLWRPASIELAQCMFLINRYLHCTSDQHKTWITAGLAIRIAQSLCCHIGETPSSWSAADEVILKEKVWATCVSLDRCISWSLGKTSALMLVPIPTSSIQGRRPAGTMRTTLHSRLYEIGAQIQLAQIQTRTGLPARSRPPLAPLQQEEYCHVALHLDALLRQWETSLPTDWQLPKFTTPGDTPSCGERYVLHLRYLHHRIFLFRPMLARFYSMKPVSPTPSTVAPSLSSPLLREGATLCIEAAQQIASLVLETMTAPAESVGILPWWYRIYFLHIAGSNFLAAMFRPELFTASVARSWDSVLLALRAHENLSLYITNCIHTLEALAAKINGTALHNIHNNLPHEGSHLEQGRLAPELCFDDIFQDMNFDFDSFVFGAGDFESGSV